MRSPLLRKELHAHFYELAAPRRFSKRSLGALAAAVAVVAIGAGCNPIGSVSDQDLNNHPFLVCTRKIESRRQLRGGEPEREVPRRLPVLPLDVGQPPRATPDATWLVGVDPAAAAPWDQDCLALHLYQWQGASPWLGRCAGQ